MSQTITIEDPNGILFDSDGRPVLVFSGWEPNTEHVVPDFVDRRRDPVYTDDLRGAVDMQEHRAAKNEHRLNRGP
jgi:hypothetical protein